MREIRFRWTFKRKDDGHIFQIAGDVDLLRESQLREMFKNKLWELVGRDQYTGLNDRNGKEIYEGDLLESESVRALIQVKWLNDSAGFNLAWTEGHKIKVVEKREQ